MNKIPKHKPNNNYTFNTKDCCNRYFIAATDILFPIRFINKAQIKKPSYRHFEIKFLMKNKKNKKLMRSLS